MRNFNENFLIKKILLIFLLNYKSKIILLNSELFEQFGLKEIEKKGIKMNFQFLNLKEC